MHANEVPEGLLPMQHLAPATKMQLDISVGTVNS